MAIYFFLCFRHFFGQNSMREGTGNKLKNKIVKFYEIYVYTNCGDVPLLMSGMEPY